MTQAPLTSLAAPVENQVSADNPDPAQHRMVQAPGGGDGLEFAADRIAMNIHGNADSHIDALCHVSFDGTLYNGVPASVVTAAGAVELSIAAGADGVVGRGVLLDIPRLRGVTHLYAFYCATVAAALLVRKTGMYAETL